MEEKRGGKEIRMKIRRQDDEKEEKRYKGREKGRKKDRWKIEDRRMEGRNESQGGYGQVTCEALFLAKANNKGRLVEKNK